MEEKSVFERKEELKQLVQKKNLTAAVRIMPSLRPLLRAYNEAPVPPFQVSGERWEQHDNALRACLEHVDKHFEQEMAAIDLGLNPISVIVKD